MEITEQYFIEKTGRVPVDDDLERCNCPQAGEIGHSCCGWCEEHQKPIFECGCGWANIKSSDLDKCVKGEIKWQE